MNLGEEMNKAKIDALTAGSWDDFEEEAINIAKKYADEMSMPKIADLTKEIEKASQTGILITRNKTELGSVHLCASLDKQFIDLDVLQDILDSNFSG